MSEVSLEAVEGGVAPNIILPPTDKPPVLLDASTQRDLLSNLRADGVRQSDLCSLALHRRDSAS